MQAWRSLSSLAARGPRSAAVFGRIAQDGGCLPRMTVAARISSSTSTEASAAAPTPAASAVISSSIPSAGSRIKHKTPRRRASSMLAELRRIEHEKGLRMNEEKQIPDFRAGDSIEVKMLSHLTSKEIDTYRGIVLGIRRNGPDSRFSIADVFLGTPILNEIPLYSPFVKSIKVLQKAYIHKGKKRVRRAKLNYLWDKRDPKEFSITG